MTSESTTPSDPATHSVMAARGASRAVTARTMTPEGSESTASTPTTVIVHPKPQYRESGFRDQPFRVRDGNGHDSGASLAAARGTDRRLADRAPAPTPAGDPAANTARAPAFARPSRPASVGRRRRRSCEDRKYRPVPWVIHRDVGRSHPPHRFLRHHLPDRERGRRGRARRVHHARHAAVRHDREVLQQLPGRPQRRRADPDGAGSRSAGAGSGVIRRSRFANALRLEARSTSSVPRPRVSSADVPAVGGAERAQRFPRIHHRLLALLAGEGERRVGPGFEHAVDPAAGPSASGRGPARSRSGSAAVVRASAVSRVPRGARFSLRG